MKLFDLIRKLAIVPFTVGTEKGKGWVYYSDGVIKSGLPFDFLEREVIVIYNREFSLSNTYGFNGLLPGIAIIVEGEENGDI